MNNWNMEELNHNYIKQLEDSYVALIQPSKLIELFKDIEEFKEWAELGDIADLKAAIRAFEKEELFTHCIILNEVLQSKTN